MTDYLLEFDMFVGGQEADIDAASFFVLEPVRIGSESTEVLSFEWVGHDDEDEEPSVYSISLGLPDRPALRHAWEIPTFFKAILTLQQLRNRRPDARIYVVDFLDDQGLEILGDDMLCGLVAAQAKSGYDLKMSWKWLAEDVVGERPTEERAYSPFFAAIAKALDRRRPRVAAKPDPSLLPAEVRTHLEAATYFTLQACVDLRDDVELASIEDAEEDGYYAIHIGFADRPDRRMMLTISSLAAALDKLELLRAIKPDACLWLSCLEILTEIKHSNLARGVVLARGSVDPDDEGDVWSVCAGCIAEYEASDQPLYLDDNTSAVIDSIADRLH
ncbi:hypothetical protein BK022_03335 [Methylorubrum extorquens]|uniref:Uncharacterized protein n=1 Tax=Methylorubrum extorquens TaxID=408 RepID=A0A1S1P9C5_METEX|nr:hypothetical protein BK022_03335 [Methylorubrum extorquens]